MVKDAGVKGRGLLEDGAVRGNEPVEAPALRQLCDAAGGGISGADARHGLKVLANERNVDLRPEGDEANLVQVGQQELLPKASAPA